MAKKTKIKTSSKPTKVKMNPVTRLKTKPIITNQNERFRNESDSIKKVLKGNIDVKIK